ncbi:endo alpha-1,4 polygalactosaminidase [Vibrio fluvialis]|nr:endo alpha-1,4 polygalactosaminidase [Vibrio fluvialis]
MYIKNNINIVILATMLATTSLVSACKENSVSRENSSNVEIERWIPAQNANWTWQLQNYRNLEIRPDVDVYDIDLFDSKQDTEYNYIDQLRKQKKKTICYFSAGTREDWRPDFYKFSEDSVIFEGEMDQWPGEVWLNISDKNALDKTIKPIMLSRLDLAKSLGCDGVEADNVDGYDNIEETKGLISYSNQLDYNKWLAKAAHSRGLSIGLKNDFGQLNELVDFFDFAVSEQCYAYDNICTSYEGNFLANGKAVFNQEYYSNGKKGEIDEYTFKNSACQYFTSEKISSLWKQGYELDGVDVERCNQ